MNSTLAMSDKFNPSSPRPVSPWIWPGLLIAFPASVVVASIITFFFIIDHPDGLVASDYYKEGRAINAKLAQLDRARALGYDQMRTELLPDRLRLHFPAGSVPGALEVNLAHPVDPDRDIIAVVQANGDGSYDIALPAALAERRRLVVTDVAQRSWRVEQRVLPDGQ